MKQIILTAFNQALRNYENMESRGCAMGFFSRIRHSFSRNLQISALEKRLNESKNDYQLIQALVSHFRPCVCLIEGVKY